MFIKGRNGVVIEVEESIGRGLVDGDHGIEEIVVESQDDEQVTEPEEETAPVVELAELPKKNASRDDWAAFALAHGKTEDDLQGQTRDQIAELFEAPAQSE